MTMEEALDDISISDRSFIVNDISGQDLVAGGLMEDENQSMEVATLNFPPTWAPSQLNRPLYPYVVNLTKQTGTIVMMDHHLML